MKGLVAAEEGDDHVDQIDDAQSDAQIAEGEPHPVQEAGAEAEVEVLGVEII